MSLFRQDASILPGTSASAELADVLEAEWSAARPGEPVVRRHLGTHPLPAEAWALAVTAGFTPDGERTPGQHNALDLAAARWPSLANPSEANLSRHDRTVTGVTPTFAAI